MDIDGSLEAAHQHSREGFASENLRGATQCTVVVDRLKM